MNKLLLGIFIGVFVTAWLSVFRIYENDVKWQMDAYNHGYAYYTFNIKEKHPKLYWHWK